jgi:hypothetical protein
MNDRKRRAIHPSTTTGAWVRKGRGIHPGNSDLIDLEEPCVYSVHARAARSFLSFLLSVVE